MNKMFQCGMLWAVGFALSAGVLSAQSGQDRPPQRQQAAPPKANAGGNRPPAQTPNANRPPRQSPPPNQNRGAEPERSAPRPQSVDRPNARQNQPRLDRNPQGNANRPPAATGNRQNGFASNDPGNRPGNDRNNGPRFRPGQQAGPERPFVDRMRDLTPPERDRVLQSSRTFQNLAPEQQ